AIVSPYPFRTAQEHYEALLEETRGRGGPPEHTYGTVPGEWTGRYEHPARAENQYWFRMRHVQIPTILSLLTPEYLYGETIGFWDGDTLITWTSNIQGWTTHAAFEHSNSMQTIEIYTPNRDGNGRFLG